MASAPDADFINFKGYLRMFQNLLLTASSPPVPSNYTDRNELPDYLKDALEKYCSSFSPNKPGAKFKQQTLDSWIKKGKDQSPFVNEKQKTLDLWLKNKRSSDLNTTAEDNSQNVSSDSCSQTTESGTLNNQDVSSECTEYQDEHPDAVKSDSATECMQVDDLVSVSSVIDSFNSIMSDTEIASQHSFNSIELDLFGSQSEGELEQHKSTFDEVQISEVISRSHSFQTKEKLSDVHEHFISKEAAEIQDDASQNTEIYFTDHVQSNENIDHVTVPVNEPFEGRRTRNKTYALRKNMVCPKKPMKRTKKIEDGKSIVNKMKKIFSDVGVNFKHMCKNNTIDAMVKRSKHLGNDACFLLYKPENADSSPIVYLYKSTGNFLTLQSRQSQFNNVS